MILDNENENLKVHEWIASYTEQGQLDIVTGYFTIGALAWLSKTVNDKISDFRLVLGDIVNFDSIDQRPLDLLNENISIEASLKRNSQMYAKLRATYLILTKRMIEISTLFLAVQTLQKQELD